MPPSTRHSETAAMFKSILLRTLSVNRNDLSVPEDIRFAKAFEPLCVTGDEKLEPDHAFTKTWLAHMDKQKVLAAEAARRFLSRYE